MRLRTQRVVPAVALVAAAAAGCGGGANAAGAPVSAGSSPSGSHASGVDPSGSARPSAGPASAVTASPGGTPSVRPGGRSGSPSASPTLPEYAPGTKPAPVTAGLASQCVTPGGPQTLTVNGPGDYYVTVDAQYSDGNDGKKYGGYYVGKIPPTGTLKLPWAVSPTAPVGSTTVWIAVEGGKPTESAFRHPTFVVANSCG
jgi:hypothetical protein